MSASPKSAERRNLLAATVGNVLEWYDSDVYGFLGLDRVDNLLKVHI